MKKISPFLQRFFEKKQVILISLLQYCKPIPFSEGYGFVIDRKATVG
jgi:hypothetical protein